MYLDFKLFNIHHEDDLYWIDVCGLDGGDFIGSLFYVEYANGEIKYDICYLSMFFDKYFKGK